MTHIDRNAESGLNGQRTFEQARKNENIEQNSYWTQQEIEIISSEELNSCRDTPFFSKIKAYFEPNFQYNPFVQIDFRGRSVKLNPLRTSFVNGPKSNTISFKMIEDADFSNSVQFEFTNDGKSNGIDRNLQCLIVQVIDNEIDLNSQDRVIAESLLTFNGFNESKRNYAKVPIYDSVEGELCGYVVMDATFEKGSALNAIGSKLQINVLGIIDLKDPNAEMVKTDNNVKRDIFLCVLWFFYMILSILFYIYGEDFTFIDALYLRIVTAFTVGYGDMYPWTDYGKVLNVLFILIDTMSIGFVISVVIGYISEFKEVQKEKRQNEKRKRNQELKMEKEKREREKKKLENNVNDDEQKDKEIAVKKATNELRKRPQQNAQSVASSLWDKHKLRILSFIIVCFVVIGTVFMVYVEEKDGASAFEWNFVTLSTVGYGDVTPQTTGGKVFVIFYIIFGVVAMAFFGSAVYEKWLERQDRKFKDQVLARALISEAQLLEFDVDGNGKIDKFEFLSKMLIETQEIDQTKIDQIMKTFEMLDADGNGEICTDELKAIENAKYERFNAHKFEDK